MLRQRLIVVILGIPSIFGLIWLGGLPYRVVWLVALALAAAEYSGILRTLKISHSMALTIGSTVLLAASADVAQPFLQMALVLVNMLYVAWAIWEGQRSATMPLFGWLLGLAGCIYLGILGGHFIALRFLPAGVWWVTLSLGCVWCADSGAYFSGHRFGHNKFAQYISPNKTWEGYWGGVLASTFCGGVFPLVAPLIWGANFPLTALPGLGLGLMIGLFSPLGDLAISVMKRQAGLKDTGNLLLSHGGVLDRIDSWFVTGALAYYYVWLLNYWPTLFK
jgi:phosphatidate cytidylyltransferase